MRPLTFAEAQRKLIEDLERRRRAKTSDHTRRELDEARAIRQHDREAEAGPRKTLAELKEKYGDDWGLDADKNAEQRRRQIEEKLAASRNWLFERECIAHGIDPKGLASPFLRERIQRAAEQLAEPPSEEEDKNS